MSRDELERSWAITRRHLDNARKALTAADQATNASLEPYEEYLAHNELELAFDELETIGDSAIRDKLFWSEMQAAATNMGLTDHAARCSARINAMAGNANI